MGRRIGRSRRWIGRFDGSRIDQLELLGEFRRVESGIQVYLNVSLASGSGWSHLSLAGDVNPGELEALLDRQLCDPPHDEELAQNRALPIDEIARRAANQGWQSMPGPTFDDRRGHPAKLICPRGIQLEGLTVRYESRTVVLRDSAGADWKGYRSRYAVTCTARADTPEATSSTLTVPGQPGLQEVIRRTGMHARANSQRPHSRRFELPVTLSATAVAQIVIAAAPRLSGPGVTFGQQSAIPTETTDRIRVSAGHGKVISPPPILHVDNIIQSATAAELMVSTRDVSGTLVVPWSSFTVAMNREENRGPIIEPSRHGEVEAYVPFVIVQ